MVLTCTQVNGNLANVDDKIMLNLARKGDKVMSNFARQDDKAMDGSEVVPGFTCEENFGAEMRNKMLNSRWVT